MDHVNFKPPLIDCLTGQDITTADYRLVPLGWAYFDILRVPFGLADILFIGEIIFIFFFLEVGFLCWCKHLTEEGLIYPHPWLGGG